MKRLLVLALTGVMVLGLAGCGSSDTVSDTSDTSAAAESSVQPDEGTSAPEEGEPDEESGETDEDQEAADAVIELIGQIGTVTEDSGDAITTARKAYKSLTGEQKELVTNLATLKAAEKAYAALTEDADEDTEDETEETDSSDDSSDEDDDDPEEAAKQKAAAEKQANQKAANQVIKLIKAIGTVSSDSESAINKARTAYNKLSSAQKKLVTNYSTLTAAEEAYEVYEDTEKIRTTAEKYVGKNVEKLIAKIGEADSCTTSSDCEYPNGETLIYKWGDVTVYATSKDTTTGEPYLIDRVK